jgi:hypothetical protein
MRMSTFLNRIAGAALLDAGTFEDVEADRSAGPQALAVVVLASLAAGFGVSSGRDEGATLSFFIGTTLLTLFAWVAWALVMYTVGTVVFPAKATRTDTGELLRTLGFAAAPGLLQVFGAVPGATGSVFALAIVWTLAATVIAVRQALDFESTGRALAVCAFGWLLSLVIAALIGLAFAPGLLAAWPRYAPYL